MQFQITEIEFDCSLDDDDWTEKDQLETEEFLPSRYIGTIWDADDEGFEMYRDGGAPPEHTRQALAEISQAVQLKITLYYEKAEDDFALVEFTPEPDMFHDFFGHVPILTVC